MKANSRGDVSLFLVVAGVLMLGMSYVLYMNVKSSILQRRVKEELNSKTLKMKSDFVIKSFPSIPNLTSVAEPTEVQKARYLINEKKYDEAYKMLTEKNSSPFDGRREFFLTMMFYNQKKYDSAIHYGEKTLRIKPRFYQAHTLLASSYELTKQYDKSVELWKEYVKHTKSKLQPWRIIVGLSNNLGKTKQALVYTDSLKKYFPKEISKPKAIVGNLYKRAVDKFKSKQYKDALALYNDFLKTTPNHPGALESRAYCYYFQRKYKQSNTDIDALEKVVKKLKTQVINLRGVNYYNLKDNTKACKSFKKAKDLGDKDGISNYKKFCK